MFQSKIDSSKAISSWEYVDHGFNWVDTDRYLQIAQQDW